LRVSASCLFLIQSTRFRRKFGRSVVLFATHEERQSPLAAEVVIKMSIPAARDVLASAGVSIILLLVLIVVAMRW